jgi:hypothetical protein
MSRVQQSLRVSAFSDRWPFREFGLSRTQAEKLRLAVDFHRILTHGGSILREHQHFHA